MGEPLYTPEILRLALATAAFNRLPKPKGTAEKRSPVCGSRITIDVTLDAQGRLDQLGQEVRACALGQASSALLDAGARGRSLNEIASARDALRNWLAGQTDSPGDWQGLGMFAAARSHPARHPAILLPFDALAEAMERAHAG